MVLKGHTWRIYIFSIAVGITVLVLLAGGAGAACNNGNINNFRISALDWNGSHDAC